MCHMDWRNGFVPELIQEHVLRKCPLCIDDFSTNFVLLIQLGHMNRLADWTKLKLS